MSEIAALVHSMKPKGLSLQLVLCVSQIYHAFLFVMIRFSTSFDYALV